MSSAKSVKITVSPGRSQKPVHLGFPRAWLLRTTMPTCKAFRQDAVGEPESWTRLAKFLFACLARRARLSAKITLSQTGEPIRWADDGEPFFDITSPTGSGAAYRGKT